MRSGFRLTSLLVGVALVGCPDWSRPDPRLRTASGARPAPADRPVAAPAEPTARDRGPPAAVEATGLGALRDGVAALRSSLDGADALERLERLEGLGWNLLERGTPDEQREAEALLEQLTELRVELVSRRGGS